MTEGMSSEAGNSLRTHATENGTVRKVATNQTTMYTTQMEPIELEETVHKVITFIFF